jgi:hypothetical protein
VEEDVEALPRHPWRRRKTPSEASPWSTVAMPRTLMG